MESRSRCAAEKLPSLGVIVFSVANGQMGFAGSGTALPQFTRKSCRPRSAPSISSCARSADDLCMKATKPLSCVQSRTSSSSRGHMILTLAMGPYLANARFTTSSSTSRGKLPTNKLVLFPSPSPPARPRSPGPSPSCSFRRARSRSSCFAINSLMNASIARGLASFPFPAKGVDVEAVSFVLVVASSSSITSGGANGGTYISRRPSPATSSSGRDPAACVPALTKFIPDFLDASKLSANSSYSSAASTACRLRFSSSSSLAF
mmetsp:Transcript_11484/g.37974  ORF Transcript_11484/g.37974 Transcript_11484/m.37974 type:complete len:263 (+) Transcript_11484:494-1282(+)